MSAEDVEAALRLEAHPDGAAFAQRFFKTGEGQYGEGDVFLGVRVPATRTICKRYKNLTLAEIQKLLDSPIHECRQAGLIIMTLQYPKADSVGQKKLYELYLKNVYAGQVNNWDLVDVSAEKIVGPYLQDKPRSILFQLARSDDLWQRRVAILSTFHYIKQGQAETTLELATILLHDPHDLIQKAVGWMLREVGKRCGRAKLTDFLDTYAGEMPRTMLRYSLEHLPPDQRAHYMRIKSQSTN